MAVEVVRRGNLLMDYSFEAECEWCQSHLRVSADDTDAYYREQYSGDQREPGSAYDRLGCKCPVCGGHVHLARTSEVPLVVRARVLSRVRTSR